MSNDHFALLFKKYIDGTMTDEELSRLQHFIRDAGNTDALDKLLQASYTNPSLAVNSEHDLEDVFRELMQKQRSSVWRLKHPARRYWLAAATIVLMLGAGIAMWMNRKPADGLAIMPAAAMPADVMPGGERATLTLADGSTVLLDSLANGTIASQGNATVTKLANGKLAYTFAGNILPAAGYNVLTTPRGGQYQLILPDGSRVWLNAASSVRYPTAFNGHDRTVEVSGEAFFEVAQDSKRPFFVNAGNVKVNVLGTSFNINAYSDEETISTTLLEGAVGIEHSGKVKKMIPGQQARVAINQAKGTGMDDIKIIGDVNTGRVTAWKYGAFDFQDAKLKEVMRQLARWYDIDIKYEEGVQNIEFWGKMGKNLSLKQVLKGLEGSGVHFRLENKNLFVLP